MDSLNFLDLKKIDFPFKKMRLLLGLFSEGLNWFPISAESVEWLDRSFSQEEIHNVVLHLNKEKAPKPDGFIIGFIRSVGR